MSGVISQKQLEANRRNAQLSTGPKTPEGKRRVRWNALNKPVGILEEMLVEKIAVAYWRLGRAVRAEVGEIRDRLLHWNELEAEEWERDKGQGQHDIQISRLALLSRYASDKIVRYETAIDRRLNKAIDQLERLQRRRQRDNTLRSDKRSDRKK
jgi:uncharacterized protein YcbK (DUF882 family)